MNGLCQEPIPLAKGRIYNTQSLPEHTVRARESTSKELSILETQSNMQQVPWFRILFGVLPKHSSCIYPQVG